MLAFIFTFKVSQKSARQIVIKELLKLKKLLR